MSSASSIEMTFQPVPCGTSQLVMRVAFPIGVVPFAVQSGQGSMPRHQCSSSRRVEECSRLEEQSTKIARADGTATSGAVLTST
jgi:hypothetical protein